MSGATMRADSVRIAAVSFVVDDKLIAAEATATFWRKDRLFIMIFSVVLCASLCLRGDSENDFTTETPRSHKVAQRKSLFSTEVSQQDACIRHRASETLPWCVRRSQCIPCWDQIIVLKVGLLWRLPGLRTVPRGALPESAQPTLSRNSFSLISLY